MTRLRQLHRCAADAERDALRVALALASPKRAEPGRVIAAQADAAHLPLFVASNEPTLF